MTRNFDLQGSPCLGDAFMLPSGVRIKNRLVKAAMSEQLGNRHHDPSIGLQNLYRAWADGGIGLSVSGNIMVDRNAISELRNVVLDARSDLEAFKRWTEEGKRNETQFWAQLNHPGKQIVNLLCEEPMAPSAISMSQGLEKYFNKPRALSEQGIQDIIGQFATSARLCKSVGFTGIQLHGAHGYLVSQFLSPRHNLRTDRWGGDLANRMRFLIEVYQAMRDAVGRDYPIGVKLNSADFMRGGFTEEESADVVCVLGRLGVDQLEISGGTYENPVMTGEQGPSTRQREAYFLSYAAKVREVSDVPLVVTGGFRSVRAMGEALSHGATDFIGLARPLALVPDLPAKVLSQEDYRVDLPQLTTGVATLDQLATLNVSWYEHQLQRIARGLAPNPKMSEWSSLGRVLRDYGVCLLHKRRVAHYGRKREGRMP